MSELYLKQWYRFVWSANKSTETENQKKQEKEAILDKDSKSIRRLFKASPHLNKRFLTRIYFSLTVCTCIINLYFVHASIL